MKHSTWTIHCNLCNHILMGADSQYIFTKREQEHSARKAKGWIIITDIDFRCDVCDECQRKHSISTKLSYTTEELTKLSITTCQSE